MAGPGSKRRVPARTGRATCAWDLAPRNERRGGAHQLRRGQTLSRGESLCTTAFSGQSRMRRPARRVDARARGKKNTPRRQRPACPWVVHAVLWPALPDRCPRPRSAVLGKGTGSVARALWPAHCARAPYWGEEGAPKAAALAGNTRHGDPWPAARAPGWERGRGGQKQPHSPTTSGTAASVARGKAGNRPRPAARATAWPRTPWYS